jgi:hypothetical protein
MRLLGGKNALGLKRDHFENQRVLVREVVIKLRLAHAARSHHLIQARSVDAMLVNQIGRRVHDTRTRCRAACGQETGLRMFMFRHAGTSH